MSVGGISSRVLTYRSDFANGEAVLELLLVEGSELVTPLGPLYRALQLGGHFREITVPVLRKIRDFVNCGITSISEHPIGSPVSPMASGDCRS